MALVLARKVGESIVIDNDIIVKLIEIRGERVRLAITADKSVKVFRSEVWLQINPGKTLEDVGQ